MRTDVVLGLQESDKVEVSLPSQPSRTPGRLAVILRCGDYEQWIFADAAQATNLRAFFAGEAFRAAIEKLQTE